MSNAGERKLGLGVAGLGRAFTLMLPTFAADPRVALVAAADTRAEARQRFAADFAAKSYATVEELCADPAVEAVYVATPHQFHARHAVLAAQHGKHLLIEKPMALSLADCSAIIAAVERARVRLVIGHSHSFDAPVARLRALIESGAFGPVRMINAINYTDYLYRPRRPEELDTAQGGGAVFNQAAHQIDMVRLVGGGRVESVRALTGAWDAARPTEGAYAALLTFAGGAFASLTYGGFGHFDSDEWQGWIGEMGQAKAPYPGPSRPRFASPQEEAAFKNARNYGGGDYRPLPAGAPAHQHFGTLLVSCAHADLRALSSGVMIYQNGTARLDPVPPPAVPRAEVIDELYAAVVHGAVPRHGGAWGMATLEVVLAVLRSAREGRDITLTHQVGLP
ncbi:MAG TPA: Gfo/Idh/MocA family oxidoreductase [Xanthobacteraceae bacterium]|nr:Gfo/Idh/MocA family oxidoreductase [Xanthobacteraceae bacterium]